MRSFALASALLLLTPSATALGKADSPPSAGASAPAKAKRRQASTTRPLALPAGKAALRAPAAVTLAPAPDAEDPHALRMVALQQALREAIHRRPLSLSRVGIEVLDASTGKLIFAHNAQRLFDPASNAKILTTATALSRLGPEYRYPTVLFGAAPDESGSVAGALHLRGSGDPSLRTQDLADLVRQVLQRGVTRITGDLVVEERAVSSATAPLDTSDAQDDLGYTPLALNRSTFGVRIRATSIGDAPEVSVDPPSPYLLIENRAKTVARGRSRIRVSTSRGKDATIVHITGRIPAGHNTLKVRRRPLHPALFTAHTLAQILRDLGVDFAGRVRTGAFDAKATPLATHQSQPLALIIRSSNKDSNNFVAERIFQTVGAELFGAPATTAKGQRAVIEYLTQLGLRPGTFQPTNGSGLWHTNRITPNALTTLLRRLLYDMTVAPDFLQSLAVGGVDGTIQKRFAGTSAHGFVRAKTGTLNGVAALSGYVGHKEDVLVFSILAQGFRPRRLHDVRRAQVRMVTAMMSYLRGNEAESGASPEATPMDIESTIDETVDLPQNLEPPAKTEPPPKVAPPATPPPQPPANVAPSSPAPKLPPPPR